jgi:hypothetical protein
MSRIQELALYCGIGLLLAAVAIFVGVYRANRALSLGIPTGWIGFGVLTMLVFWWGIRAHRPVVASAGFWTGVAVFAVVHCVLGYLILSRWAERLSLVDFALATPVEYYVLTAYLRFVVRPKTQ